MINSRNFQLVTARLTHPSGHPLRCPMTADSVHNWDSVGMVEKRLKRSAHTLSDIGELLSMSTNIERTNDFEV